MQSKVVILLLGVMLPILALTSCGTAGSGGSAAAAFPSKEVTVHVPYEAGGSSDLLMRALAPAMEKELGQTVVVVNTPGATGSLAMNKVLNSRPDGHTLVLGAPGPVITAPLLNEVGYTTDDAAPIGQVAREAPVLTVRSDSPYDTVEEFFQAAEDNPNEISIGTPGASSVQQFAVQQLAESRDIPVKPVPFDGGTPAISALLGGDITSVLLVESNVIPSIEADRFKPLGIASEEKSTFLPDVPTLPSEGYNLVNSIFYGLLAPKDTPPEVVDKLEGALQAALADEEVTKKLEELYITPEFRSAEDFQRLIDEQYNRYEPILSEQRG